MSGSKGGGALCDFSPDQTFNYATIDVSYVKFYEGSIPSQIEEYLYQTHYQSDLAAIRSFSDTSTSGERIEGNSWFASRYVFSHSHFGVLYVYDDGDEVYAGNDADLYIITSSGLVDTHDISLPLVPVVSLESGVKIIEGSGDGSENSPWQLTK